MSNRHADLVIIGAGAAGLLAARRLAEAGQRVILIEARNRVGGRIFSVAEQYGENSLPFFVELGAEFVHGLPPVTWRLIRESGLQSHELEGTQACFERNVLGPCGPHMHQSFEVLANMSRWLEAQPPGTDCTFAQYLATADIDPSVARPAIGYVEGFNAADSRVIGVASLAHQQRAEDAIEADRIFHVEPGYNSLTDFLRHKFHDAGGVTLLNHECRTLCWSRGAVACQGMHLLDCFEITAQRAIITVPLGVLQSGSLAFEPVLPSIAADASRMAMGHVVRVVLVFKQKFWEQQTPGLGFLFDREGIIPTWWTAAPGNAPTLTAWAGGATAASRVHALRAQGALIRQLLLGLAKIFSLPVNDLQALLQGAHMHDWQNDPFSRGAYSYVPAHAMDVPARLGVPVAKTLYFAGEHTVTDGHWGTVHAALSSGLRVADQVLEAISSG